jgi:dipeptidyl aminopeptidase/acylaminoacyl peptidase
MSLRIAPLATAVSAAALFGVAAPANPSAQPPRPPPVNAFVGFPACSMARLPPDGKGVALVGVRDGVQFLATVDLDTGKADSLASFPEGTLTNYWWKGSGLILAQVNGARLGRFFDTFLRINAVTKKVEQVEDFDAHLDYVVDSLPGDPANLLVAWNVSGRIQLRRVDVGTGKTVVVDEGQSGLIKWYADSNGRALAAVGREEKKWFLLRRSDDTKPWVRDELGSGRLAELWPWAISSASGGLVCSDQGSAGGMAVVRVDLADGRRSTVCASEGVDPDMLWAARGDHTRLRVLHEEERPRSFFTDDEDRLVSSRIDAALPDGINLIGDVLPDRSVLIVRSVSDRRPGQLYFLNRRAGQLKIIGSERPDLRESDLGTTQYFTFQNEGRTLHGRVWLPRNRPTPPPLVVQVGPAVNGPRSRYEFDPICHLLASRGIATARIDYRGVDGYGKEFAQAGDGEIARGMPEDVVAGIRWLQANGLVDKNRAAIWGIHHGGIVALAALAQHPDVFTAWVDFDTPLARGYLGVNEAVPATCDAQGRFGKLGSERKVLDYLDTIRPEKMLEDVKVPAFCYYDRYLKDNTTAYDGDRAASHFKKLKVACTFVKGPMIQDLWNADIPQGSIWLTVSENTYSQLLDFLGAQFHLEAR